MDRLTAEVAPVPPFAKQPAVRLKARIIIPVWGAKYLARLNAGCLPALLAPGNLPSLAEHFDCELVIVTESGLFDAVRALDGVRKAQRWCSLRLTAMDDVLSHPTYYGYTITEALYRGFTDLGEEAKNVWCLFLNADFILADGSYRSLAQRMLAGARCILAPSYCTIEEEVRPAMQAAIAEAGGMLALAPRRMAEMILASRHYTIRAKTINWRMYRIDHVDQLYFEVDRQTLVGRQIPIAVVAFRPERVPDGPVAFWDYGVVSEVVPSRQLSVLGDSDDFLMMELRARDGMANWLKLGWMDTGEIASSLSRWSTPDQRACAEYPLVLHSADIPASAEAGLRALQSFWTEVQAKMKPNLSTHLDHYIWSGTLALHQKWREARAAGEPGRPQAAGRGLLGALVASSFKIGSHAGRVAFRRAAFDLLESVYVGMFGRAPALGVFHPQRLDVEPTTERLRAEGRSAKRALAVCALSKGSVAPFLGQWVPDVTQVSIGDFDGFAKSAPRGAFDLCFLELDRDAMVRFGAWYRELRPLMKQGGRVLVFCQTRGMERMRMRDAVLIHGGLPGTDLPQLEFRGGFLAHMTQALWEALLDRLQNGGRWEYVRFAVLASALAPFALLANALAPRPGTFRRSCTSLLLELTIL